MCTDNLSLQVASAHALDAKAVSEWPKAQFSILPLSTALIRCQPWMMDTDNLTLPCAPVHIWGCLPTTVHCLWWQTQVWAVKHMVTAWWRAAECWSSRMEYVKNENIRIYDNRLVGDHLTPPMITCNMICLKKFNCSYQYTLDVDLLYIV